MKLLRTAAVLCIGLLCGIGLFACNSGKTSSEDTWVYSPNSNPDVPDPGSEDDDYTGLGLKNEIVFDRISVKLEKEKYSLSGDKEISCIVMNENPGHGFYMYPYPYIERLSDGGEWIRLCNKIVTRTEGLENFVYIAGTANADNMVYCESGILIEDIVPEAAVGHYRLVFFFPKNVTVYAEFDIIQ